MKDKEPLDKRIAKKLYKSMGMEMEYNAHENISRMHDEYKRREKYKTEPYKESGLKRKLRETKEKFKKTKTEKKVSDKNSTEKDAIDKKSVHHGSKIKGALKKGKEEKISSGFKNGKVSGDRLKPKKDPAFSKATSFEERKELLRKKYRG